MARLFVDKQTMALALATSIDGALNPLIPCVGCGAPPGDLRRVLRANGTTLPFDLVACRQCRLVQQNPRISVARNTAQYDNNYYVFQENEPLRWARAAQQYAVHLRPLESRAPRRLLDIGCALGHLCALARSRGWRVTGLDVAAGAASEAARRFGLDVRAGLLAQHISTLPRFDVVFLGDVIEHVDDPVALLKDVSAALAPGGMVCIDTPNWNSLWRRLGRSRWVGINQYHINLFNADSLSALLVRTGFVDVHCDSDTHYRYAAAGARPEPAAIVDALPAALAWRVRRGLNLLSRWGRWADLRTRPPGTLDAAAAWVQQQARATAPLGGSRLRDNLIARGRKP